MNLGIGQPTLVANYLPGDIEVVLHSENGTLGMEAAPAAGEEDYDLINAGKQLVTRHFVAGRGLFPPRRQLRDDVFARNHRSRSSGTLGHNRPE